MPNCASVETSLLTLDRYSENREPRKSWQSVLWNHPLRSPICLLPANICVCVPAVGHSAKLYNLDSVPWTLAFLFQLFFPIFLRTENHRVWGYEDCWRFGAIGRRTCGKTAVSRLMNSGSNNIPHMGQIDGDGCLDSDLPWMHIISGTYYVFQDRERMRRKSREEFRGPSMVTLFDFGRWFNESITLARTSIPS